MKRELAGLALLAGVGYIARVEARSASPAQGDRDVVACQGPADQAVMRQGVDSVGAWSSRIGLLGIRAELQIRLWAKASSLL